MWIIVKLLLIVFFVKFFSYPGAFIRYVASDKTRSLGQILNEDKNLNSSIGFLMLFALILVLIAVLEIFFPDFDWYFHLMS